MTALRLTLSQTNLFSPQHLAASCPPVSRPGRGQQLPQGWAERLLSAGWGSRDRISLVWPGTAGPVQSDPGQQDQLGLTWDSRISLVWPSATPSPCSGAPHTLGLAFGRFQNPECASPSSLTSSRYKAARPCGTRELNWNLLYLLHFCTGLKWETPISAGLCAK